MLIPIVFPIALVLISMVQPATARQRAGQADATTPAPAPAQSSPPPAPDQGANAPAGGGAIEATGDCIAALAAEGAISKPGETGSPADPRCVIAQPVRLEALAPKNGRRIDLPDRPLLACIEALAFARYVDELLAPLAKGAFDAAISAIATGPGFDCRTRDRVEGAKLSEHAKGLALDIAVITFAGGRTYRVGELADEPARAFDRAARSGACGYFHTALGPGADAAHAHHWHFDLEQRGRDGAAKFCQ